MNDTPTSDATELRVRSTLHTVAETVTEDAFAHAGRPAEARKPRWKKRIALGVGVLTLIPAGMATATIVNVPGDEYVEPIPHERVVASGSVDGSRYLLIESNRTDECGNPVTGVELFDVSKNPAGSEWNTTGYEYGEYVDKPCGYVNDASRYLTDPALFNASGAQVGDSMVWVYAVHPDVDTVRITSGDDFTKELQVHPVDGAGYAPFEIPDGMTEYTSELLIDGQVVPGSEQERTVGGP